VLVLGVKKSDLSQVEEFAGEDVLAITAEEASQLPGERVAAIVNSQWAGGSYLANSFPDARLYTVSAPIFRQNMVQEILSEHPSPRMGSGYFPKLLNGSFPVLTITQPLETGKKEDSPNIIMPKEAAAMDSMSIIGETNSWNDVCV